MRAVYCDMCGNIVKDDKATVVEFRDFYINPSFNMSNEPYQEPKVIEVCSVCKQKILSGMIKR